MEVLADEKKIAIVCSFKGDGKLKCLKYNIADNSFCDSCEISDSACKNLPTNLMMDYFYETEEITFGCNGYSTQTYVNTFSKNSGFKTSKTITKTATVEKGFFILSGSQYTIMFII